MKSSVFAFNCSRMEGRRHGEGGSLRAEFVDYPLFMH